LEGMGNGDRVECEGNLKTFKSTLYEDKPKKKEEKKIHQGSRRVP